MPASLQAYCIKSLLLSECPFCQSRSPILHNGKVHDSQMKAPLAATAGDGLHKSGQPCQAACPLNTERHDSHGTPQNWLAVLRWLAVLALTNECVPAHTISQLLMMNSEELS